MWGNIAISFLLAFIVSFMATPYSIKIAEKIGAIDIPKDDRRMRKKSIPKLGGLAVITGFAISLIYLISVMNIEGSINLFDENMYLKKLIGVGLGVIIITITGVIDDTKTLKPLQKLFGQVLAAVVAVGFGIRISAADIPFIQNTELANEISMIVTVIWIIGITNAINLIDGLDGLSSGIALISCISLLIIFATNGSSILSIILITALAGGIVGFLPFNFNPAKTFVGDVGSNFLGFSLAVISILGVAKTYTVLVLIAPLIVLGLPIFDTIFAIFRRIIKGKSLKAVFKPDKGHLHHRLMAKGYTQKQAVLILYGLSATLGMFAIILLDSGLWKALSFALLVVAIIAVGYKDIFKKTKTS